MNESPHDNSSPSDPGEPGWQFSAHGLPSPPSAPWWKRRRTMLAAVVAALAVLAVAVLVIVQAVLPTSDSSDSENGRAAIFGDFTEWQNAVCDFALPLEQASSITAVMTNGRPINGCAPANGSGALVYFGTYSSGLASQQDIDCNQFGWYTRIIYSSGTVTLIATQTPGPSGRQALAPLEEFGFRLSSHSADRSETDSSCDF